MYPMQHALAFKTLAICVAANHIGRGLLDDTGPPVPVLAIIQILTRAYFRIDLSVLPISAGLRVTLMPQASITASFSCAVPLPPEIIAPA